MLLSLDSETHLIQPGLLAPPSVCWSFCSEGGEPFLLGRGGGIVGVATALHDPTVVIVGHNIAYDFAVAAADRLDLLPAIFAAYEAGRVRDTMLRAQLLDIRQGRRQYQGRTEVCINGTWVAADYSMAGQLLRYLGEDRSSEKNAEDAWRKRYAELAHLDPKDYPAAAREYALRDAVDPLRIHAHQQRLAEAVGYTDPELEGALVNEREQVYAAFCLHLVSCWGMRTDGAAVAALEAEARKRWRGLQERMYAEGLFRVERCTPTHVRGGKVDFYGTALFRKKPLENQPLRYVRDTAAVQARVVAAYAKLGKPAPRNEVTEAAAAKGETVGSIKTDADTLEYSGDELLEELAGTGPIGTILKTFLPTLRRGVEVPINTKIRPLLNTGRPSASDPNVFNLPREGGVRECIVPRPGFVFCSVDYDGAELRSHAQVLLEIFGQSDLAAFFQKNPHGDPYIDLAGDILGVPGEELQRWREEPCTHQPDCRHCRAEGMRQMCKPVVLGLPGGLGIDKLIDTARKSYGVILDREMALKMRAAWKARYREMQPYFDWISARVGYGGEGTLMQMRPGGKPHRIRGLVGYCDGCNTLFQGRTADGAKHALTQVMREMYVVPESPLYGSRVEVFLYDEIIASVPAAPERAHAAAQRLADIMRQSMQEWLPDVPVTCKPALMERWYKKAKPVYRDGLLVPWRPV